MDPILVWMLDQKMIFMNNYRSSQESICVVLGKKTYEQVKNLLLGDNKIYNEHPASFAITTLFGMKIILADEDYHLSISIEYDLKEE